MWICTQRVGHRLRVSSRRECNKLCPPRAFTQCLRAGSPWTYARYAILCRGAGLTDRGGLRHAPTPSSAAAACASRAPRKRQQHCSAGQRAVSRSGNPTGRSVSRNCLAALPSPSRHATRTASMARPSNLPAALVGKARTGKPCAQPVCATDDQKVTPIPPVTVSPLSLPTNAPARLSVFQWIRLNCNRMMLSRYQFTPAVTADPLPTVATPL